MPGIPVNLITGIGLLFSPIPAAMAFLITYDELRHHPLGKGLVLRRSLEAAGVTFGFFVLFAVALGALLPSLL
jgi:hypothetical protein